MMEMMTIDDVMECFPTNRRISVVVLVGHSMCAVRVRTRNEYFAYIKWTQSLKVLSMLSVEKYTAKYAQLNDFCPF